MRYPRFTLVAVLAVPDRASRLPLWGKTRPVTVDSGQKHAKRTWVSGARALHSYAESSAVEQGEGQMGIVGVEGYPKIRCVLRQMRPSHAGLKAVSVW